MSGIAGIIHFDGKPVEPGLIEKMTSAMAHRGPDGINHWVKGSVALGQCMLRTTPESLEEHQPLTNEDESLVLVMDGRVDNRQELADKLKEKGFHLRNDSDAELVLRAYEAWGEESSFYILGDFAYILWDSRLMLLYCARDHFGNRPLYYYFASRQLFLIASDPIPLISTHLVPCIFSETRIADFLTDMEHIDYTSSFFEGILRFPPASYATVKISGLFIDKYWQPEQKQELRFRSNEEYIEAFLTVLSNSIRVRLNCYRPCGVLLSGGIDSQAIAAISTMDYMTPGAGLLETLSGVVDDSVCIESKLINLFGSRKSVVPHTITPLSIGRLIDSLKYTSDIFDTIMVLPQLLYIEGRKEGIRVVLDGVDGDLALGSYCQYISYLLRTGCWLNAVREAINTAQFQADSSGALSLLVGAAKRAFIPTWVRRVRRTISQSESAVIEDSVISRDLADRVCLQERLRFRDDTYTKIECGSLSREHARTLGWPMLTVALERYDRVAAAHSIEVRHPWTDKHLIEFCLALPRAQKRREGISKYVLRQAMGGFLSDEVRWRKGKEHVGHLFWKELLRLRRRDVYQLLENGLAELDQYIDREKVKKACENYLRGVNSDQEEEYVRDSLSLWDWLYKFKKFTTV